MDTDCQDCNFNTEQTEFKALVVRNAESMDQSSHKSSDSLQNFYCFWQVGSWNAESIRQMRAFLQSNLGCKNFHNCIQN